MSSPTPPVPSTPPSLKPPRAEQEIKIVSHSNLSYWWPVWGIGLVLGILSYFSDERMAIVPAGTMVATIPKDTNVEVDNNQRVVKLDRPTEGLIVPNGRHLLSEKQTGKPEDPHLRISASDNYAVFFIIVLLLVIVVTNVPLRGLWSIVVIMIIGFLSIIFSLLHWWERILHEFGRLHIYINAAGYFVFSLVLLAIWLAIFYLFDQQVYMIFTPGQLRLREEIGGGEKVYDTAGMHFQKQRSDLFRHWILGFGSGDLTVTAMGATAEHFNLPNVWNINSKLHRLEDMLREKPVVQG